jgi:hypothetical protein
MSNPSAVSPNFFSRILQNETARKSIAGAAAGLLVAVVSEVLWPKA